MLRTLWTAEKPAFEGRFTRFHGIDAYPRPVQRPHPPIIVGGHSPSAFRRAVRQGNGWYGFFQDLDNTRSCLAGLAVVANQVERPAERGALEIGVTPPPGCDLDTALRYRDLGVDRLVLYPLARNSDELLRFVSENAELLLSKLR